jgi:hypothetical protein
MYWNLTCGANLLFRILWQRLEEIQSRFVVLVKSGDLVGLGRVDASSSEVHGRHLVTRLLQTSFDGEPRPRPITTPVKQHIVILRRHPQTRTIPVLLKLQPLGTNSLFRHKKGQTLECKSVLT